MTRQCNKNFQTNAGQTAWRKLLQLPDQDLNHTSHLCTKVPVLTLKTTHEILMSRGQSFVNNVIHAYKQTKVTTSHHKLNCSDVIEMQH